MNSGPYRNFYEQKWASKACDLPIGTQARARFLAIHTAIKRFGLTCGPSTILDLGCGPGMATPYLLEFGRVIGIDFSVEAIRKANEIYGNVADFFVGSIGVSLRDSLPLNKVDVVVCSEVIEHIESQTELLAEVFEILRPGGLAILTTPNGKNWEVCSSDARFVEGFQPIERWLSPGTLRSMFVSRGYIVLEHKGIPVSKVRVGPRAFLEKTSIVAAVKFLNLEKLYGRLILHSAVYQILTAQKPLAGSES